MVCATFVRYVRLKLWGTLFPVSVSVSVQPQPIVSGIGRQHGIGITLKISAVHHLVLSQYTHLTDRETDRIATAIPCVALHAVAR